MLAHSRTSVISQSSAAPLVDLASKKSVILNKSYELLIQSDEHPFHGDSILNDFQHLPGVGIGICRYTAVSAWMGAGLIGVKAGLKSVALEDRSMRHFEGAGQGCLQGMLERRKGADTETHIIEIVGNGGGADSSEEKELKGILKTRQRCRQPLSVLQVARGFR